MSAARVPADEPARLRSLHDLEVLDSPPDPEFDALVRAAAVVCGAPVSLVTLIGADRQWLKASTGVEGLVEVPREQALCAHAILEDGFFEVADLCQDARFADNPLVIETGIRFYAAAPLRLSDGATVGTLCVIDRTPRRLDADQRQLLSLLAVATVKALESRSTLRRLKQAAERLVEDERHLRWLYEATPAMLHSIDAQGRIVTVSDRWLERMGYAREEVVGRPAREFAVPAPGEAGGPPGGDAPGVSARIAQLFADGRFDDLPLQLKTRSGRLIEGRCSAVLERDAEGRPLRGVTVVDDITGHVQAESALQSERQRLASLTDATLAGIWELNLLTGESLVNEHWAAIVGYTLAELGPASGLGWPTLTHPEDRHRADVLGQAHIDGKTPFYEAEARMRHRDGHWVWVQSRGRVLTWTASGRAERMVGTLIDITARKQQEETLRQSERFLKRTSQVAGVGGWELDCTTNTLFLSDAVCLMVDCEPGHRPTAGELRDAYTPKTRKVMAGLDRRARATGLGWDVEIEVYSFKNRRLWLRNVAEVESANGVPMRIVGSTQDITALVEQRRAVEQAKERLALATESGGIGIWELEVRSRTLLLDALCCKAYGIDATEATLALEEWLALMHPEDHPPAIAAAKNALNGGPAFDIGVRMLRPDGSLRHVRVTARVTRDDAGRPSRMIGACWDVTQIHRLGAELAEQHELLRVTLQSIGDAVVTTDAAGHVTWLNPIAERMTGWPVADAKGRPLAQVFCIVHEATRERAENPVDLCLQRGATTGVAHLTLLVSRDGNEYGIEDSAAPICNDRGDVLGAVLVFHDVTETRRLASEMSHRAMHDALTGLVNRAEFEARLARLLARAQSDHSQHALLYIDLDQFKIVNDTCGHSVGDRLLQQVAKLLGESMRSRDTVARLGGDEFGVILEHCAADQAEHIAQQICDRMNEARFVHDAKRFRIGTSIGLVPLDSRWDAVSGLMQAADTSCYAAKEAGRNRVHVWFDTDLTMRARHSETRWATRVEQALDENRFVLFAQRIEPIRGGALGLHAEVLLRLVDADGSLVAPGAFLPAAERFHLASRLDRWVMHHAIDALVALPDLSRIEMLSINLSGKSIGDRAFHRHALELLAGAGEAICRRLCLEITETAAVTNLADAALFIEQVRALGVRIALDDFGAGASSFGYLKTLKVDVLKIDGQFIKDVLDDPLDDAAVRCFVDVARVMGLKTVAEFVDSPAVLARLGAIGVDYAQGYLLHRPEPIGNVIGVLPAPAPAPHRTGAATMA